MQANQLMGPVTISTRDRTIELDDVAGPVSVTNRNGAVSVTSAMPLGPVDINNQHGSVDLGLPEHGGFVLDAQTHNGDLENDFDLASQGQDDQHWLAGTVGAGGPKVHVVTSDGDITIRKSVAPPVPPKAPPPPRISTEPPAPGAAASPKVRHAGRVARPAVAPVKPAAPTGPASTGPATLL
jgi:hypothetical protein